MKPEALKIASANLKGKYPNVLIEASGGISLETLPNYFMDTIDVISMGGLTQSVPHVDFSLKIAH